MFPCSKRRTFHRRAFTLVELVIVVVIIGIVAAIAVPRLSKASGNASGKALEATLTNVRKAMELYYAEHGKYPGYAPLTNNPDDARFEPQLTLYTNKDGLPSAGFGASFIFGPYLRAPFPKNPTNDLKTVKVKANPGDADPGEGTVGWIAVLSTGAFGMSATDSGLDASGITDADTKTRLRMVK